MKHYHVVSYHFKRLDIPLIGKLFIPEENRSEKLPFISAHINAREFFYLATCNRVECHIVSDTKPCPYKLAGLLSRSLSDGDLSKLASEADVLSGYDAVRHIFSTAASLNSMVTGEREIITQVRMAYEQSRNLGLTGDFIRLLMRQTIETAKRIYTETGIARMPVSVVSLAFSEVSRYFSSPETRILVVGAGQTNTNMVRLLVKNGYKSLVITNRTDSRARELSLELGVTWLPWEEKHLVEQTFDVVISCTGSNEPVITLELFTKWTLGAVAGPMLVDLALPADAEEKLVKSEGKLYVGLSALQDVSDKNMLLRKSELDLCESIVDKSIGDFVQLTRERSVEVAMSDVPLLVKKIRQQAMEEVFARDLASLDKESRDVVEKILDYMEKKYIAMPIKKAKEVLLEKAFHGN